VSWLLIVLRFTHVVFGALWVGMMFFTVVFLTPAIRDAGPPGGAVMAAIQRRKVMTVTPIFGLLTLASGFWLVESLYGGWGAMAASRTGMMLSLGAAASLVAFAIGLGFMRPAMLRAAALSQAAGQAASDDERQRLTREAQGYRARSTVLGRVVASLLVLALATMAVARYL